MGIRDYALQKVKSTPVGARLVEDKRFRTLTKAVVSLIGNLAYAFYNAILGVISAAPVFVVSAVYYILLWAMRFAAVMLERKGAGRHDRIGAAVIGVMLMILGVVFHVMVIVSMQHQTAAVYGTIPMIAIATFTFTKITTAAISAVKHRKDGAKLIKAINTVRYAEIAVSLLTMQQSMLVSFGEADDSSAVLLNALTGAGVCFFIIALGVITFKNSKKDVK